MDGTIIIPCLVFNEVVKAMIATDKSQISFGCSPFSIEAIRIVIALLLIVYNKTFYPESSFSFHSFPWDASFPFQLQTIQCSQTIPNKVLNANNLSQPGQYTCHKVVLLPILPLTQQNCTFSENIL